MTGLSMLQRALLILLLCWVSGACSIERYAKHRLADALSESGSTFASDNDPDLVREAAPFSLKLMETLLSATPEHDQLLVAVTRGFTQYSWAFVQQDAERMESTDLAAAEHLRLRAQRLYLRARDYGLRALEVRYPGLGQELRAAPRDATAKLRREDTELAFWLGAAWGGALTQAKDSPELLADQAIVEALFDAVLALDEGFESGAMHAVLIAYERSRPGGARNWVERARKHFQRAVELSEGRVAAPYVALAESVAVQEQRLAEFEDLLARALAIDPDVVPTKRLENCIYQARARWLLARKDELFLE